MRVQCPGNDKGTTFIIQLEAVVAPAAEDNGADGERSIDLKTGVAQKHRLLVVDDHADTCTGMKMMLERRGYDITVAHSAGQAAEKTQQEDFDLLISDIGLPDRSGYELMSELRQSKGLRGLAHSCFGVQTDANT